MVHEPILSCASDVYPEIAVSCPRHCKIMDPRYQRRLIRRERVVPHGRPIDAKRQTAALFADTVGCLDVRDRLAPPPKRLYRLYRDDGLGLRLTKPRRNVSAANRDRQPAAAAANEMWSMDFVSDVLFGGERLCGCSGVGPGRFAGRNPRRDRRAKGKCCLRRDRAHDIRHPARLSPSARTNGVVRRILRRA